MDGQLPLFDVTPPPAPAAVEEGVKLSADRKRTLQQAAQLAAGVHPLTKLGLHPQAAPADDREAEGLRCGGCRFRILLGHHNRSYPKCSYPADTTAYDGPIRAEDWDRMGRIAHSTASDVRAWWPACKDFQPPPPKVMDGQAPLPDPPS